MDHKDAVLKKISEFNKRNGKQIANPLLIKPDSITIEFKPFCNCKWGLVGAVHEIKQDFEIALGVALSVGRVREIDEKGFLVRFYAREREVLKH